MGLFDLAKDAVEQYANVFSGKATADYLGGGSDGDWKRLIPGIGDAMAAADANKANIAAADRAMAFSERMSSSAYQRVVKDMKAAGINPMLAISQGGASAPSGVTPTINPENRSGFGTALASTALGVAAQRTAAQQADTQRMSAESAVQLNQATTAKQVQDIKESDARTRKTNAETDRIRRYRHRDKAQADIEEKATRLADQLLNKIGTSAKSSSNSRTSFFDALKKNITGQYGPAPVQPPGHANRVQQNQRRHFSGGKQ